MRAVWDGIDSLFLFHSSLPWGLSPWLLIISLETTVWNRLPRVRMIANKFFSVFPFPLPLFSFPCLSYIFCLSVCSYIIDDDPCPYSVAYRMFFATIESPLKVFDSLPKPMSEIYKREPRRPNNKEKHQIPNVKS
jgi:hypothetical protein